jgi:hypothetical protein
MDGLAGAAHRPQGAQDSENGLRCVIGLNELAMTNAHQPLL